MVWWAEERGWNDKHRVLSHFEQASEVKLKNWIRTSTSAILLRLFPFFPPFPHPPQQQKISKLLSWERLTHPKSREDESEEANFIHQIYMGKFRAAVDLASHSISLKMSWKINNAKGSDKMSKCGTAKKKALIRICFETWEMLEKIKLGNIFFLFCFPFSLFCVLFTSLSCSELLWPARIWSLSVCWKKERWRTQVNTSDVLYECLKLSNERFDMESWAKRLIFHTW